MASRRKFLRNLALLCGLVLPSSLAYGGDIQELFPDSSPSWAPFVEFRGRGPAGIGHSGHAFVALGVEGNGLRIYRAIGGFYPDPKTQSEAIRKLVAGVDGKVDYDFEDMHSDVHFRTTVTASQFYNVLFVMQQWNEKEYSLPSQNCVSLATDVARTLDLKVPETVENVIEPWLQWPVPFVRYLAQNNSNSQTSSETARAQTVKDSQWHKLAETMRSIQPPRRPPPASPFRNSPIRPPIRQEPNFEYYLGPTR
ncbi:hypothetical protein [Bradyrhizobium oligotrophicum]|uniref:hypothetical protein n=1 Tax=Bradyrhizobium oligotrophicum TaxID=44255 RepID=UPI0011817CB8|nr:hypothetical protein [Bradyrhizobium oligotrophicum]